MGRQRAGGPHGAVSGTLTMHVCGDVLAVGEAPALRRACAQAPQPHEATRGSHGGWRRNHDEMTRP